MGEKAIQIVTNLSVKQCAELFRSSPQRLMSGAAKLQGLMAKVGGGVFTADFFTPRASGAFAALEEDSPDFAVGTFIRNGASAVNPTEVHMYVWDRGPHREATAVARHGLMTGTIHARKIVDSLGEMFREQDRGARVTVDG